MLADFGRGMELRGENGIQKARPDPICAHLRICVFKVDEDAYGSLEWQAYTFAGLLLVLRKSLGKHYSYQMKILKSKIDFAKLEKLPKDSYKEYVISAIARKLIRTYDVSIDVLIKRISKEIEKGAFLIP